MGFEQETAESKPVFQQFPGLFGPGGAVPTAPTGGDMKEGGVSDAVLSQLSGSQQGAGLHAAGRRIGTNLESLLGEGVRGAFGQPLEKALLQPEFGPTTSSETAILGSIMDLTAGRGAVRGLGAPTQAGLAQTIAPTLAGMRQQQIGNLMGARAQDVGVRGQDIMGLLELAGLAMPQIVGGQQTTQEGKGLDTGIGFTKTL